VVPALQEAEDAGRPFRAPDVAFDKLQTIIKADDTPLKFRSTISGEDGKAQWGAPCHVLALYRHKLTNYGLFKSKKVTDANRWKWAYMAMKCKEVLQINPRKKSQASNAHNNLEVAARKRIAQEKLRQQRLLANAAARCDTYLLEDSP
jgi:hypothetical protein